MSAISFYAFIKPLVVDRLIKAAFKAGGGAFAIIKTFDDVPGFFALGNLHERFFTDIANNQIIVVIGG